MLLLLFQEGQRRRAATDAMCDMGMIEKGKDDERVCFSN